MIEFIFRLVIIFFGFLLAFTLFSTGIIALSDFMTLKLQIPSGFNWSFIRLMIGAAFLLSLLLTILSFED